MDPDPADQHTLETELQVLLPPISPKDGQTEKMQMTKEEDVKIVVTTEQESPWNECRKQLLGIQLLRAIGDGKVMEVERRLHQGASPNSCCSKTKLSALHLAVLLCHQRIVTLLLEKGAYTRLRDRNGRQPVHIATALGHLSLLQTLLDCDPTLLNSPVTKETVDGEETITSIYVDVSDLSINDALSQIPNIIDGSTPLHISVENLHSNCTKELLGRGAVKNLTDNWAVTPLHTIGRAGVKTMDVKTSPMNSVFENSWHKDTNKALNSSKSSLSLLDLEGSQPEIAQHEISEVPKANSTDTLDMLKWLVAYGVEYFSEELSQKERIDFMETTCLHNAIRNDDIALIEYVIEQFGCEILLVRNKEGHTGLHLAVELNKWQLVELLLSTNMIHEGKMKQVVNGRDRLGRTPLHLAARTGNLQDVNLLLTKGADVNIVAFDGSTVLHYAAENPNPDVMEELLLNYPICKVQINTEDSDCMTPICKAVSNGFLHTTCLLVEHGADVTHRRPGIKPWKEYSEFLENVNPLMRQRLPGEEEWIEPRNVTLLHLASIKGHTSILQLLLKDQQVDKKFRSVSWRGNTALHFAVMKGSVGCVEVLLRSGFQINKANGKGQTPYCLAVAMNRNDILQLFIAHDHSNVAGQARLAAFLAAFYGYADCMKSIIYSTLNQTDSSLRLTDIPWSQMAYYDDSHNQLLRTLLDEGCEVTNHSFEDPDCRISLNHGYFNSISRLKVLKSILTKDKRDEQDSILLHPFIETFLHVKWKSLKNLVFIYIKIYVLFVTLLTAVGTLHYFVHSQSRFLTVTIHFLGILSHVMKTWQDLSELRRMRELGLWGEYWRDKETWLTWATDALSLLVLLGPHPATWLRYVSGVAVLMSWLEVLCILSRWPSRIGYNIHLFFIVCKNTIKVLLPFSVALLGFMFAFSLCKPRRSLNHLWLSLLKVMAMTVELDFNSIAPNQYHIITESLVTGCLILAFLIMISISLMNLLVSLTVRDVTVLEMSASRKRIADQIDYLSVVEALSFQSVVRWFYYFLCLGPCSCDYPRCWYCFLVSKPVVISPALSRDDFDSFELPINLRKRVIDHVKMLKSLKQKNKLE